MIGASKILTVSYGTFSCTLEGFEEPFSTMKAIAEYFRDLAAEDRYFGAEPPTPDAEMLHRIAEREIQRRVEAKIQANGVILRPEGHDAAAAERPAAPVLPKAEAATAPAVAPVAATAAPIVAPPALTEDEDEDAAWEMPVRPARAAEPAETVAQKLARIRAAVADVKQRQEETDPFAAPAASSAPAATDEDEDEAAAFFAAATAVATAPARAEPDAAPEEDLVAFQDAEPALAEPAPTESALAEPALAESALIETAVAEPVEDHAAAEYVATESTIPDAEADTAAEEIPAPEALAIDDVDADADEAAGEDAGEIAALEDISADEAAFFADEGHAAEPVIAEDTLAAAWDADRVEELRARDEDVLDLARMALTAEEAQALEAIEPAAAEIDTTDMAPETETLAADAPADEFPEAEEDTLAAILADLAETAGAPQDEAEVLLVEADLMVEAEIAEPEAEAPEAEATVAEAEAPLYADERDDFDELLARIADEDDGDDAQPQAASELVSEPAPELPSIAGVDQPVAPAAVPEDVAEDVAEDAFADDMDFEAELAAIAEEIAQSRGGDLPQTTVEAEPQAVAAAEAPLDEISAGPSVEEAIEQAIETPAPTADAAEIDTAVEAVAEDAPAEDAAPDHAEMATAVIAAPQPEPAKPVPAREGTSLRSVIDRARARVIKVRRADVEAPVAVPPAAATPVAANPVAAPVEAAREAQPEMSAPAPAAMVRPADDTVAPRRPSLRQRPAPEGDDSLLASIARSAPARQAEASDEDLLAQLAAAEEAVRPIVPRRPVAQRPADPAPEPEAGAQLRRLPADDAAVSRLIETANKELTGPEHRRRYSAIAHLKAAVIATAADRALGERGPQDGDATEAYREDLGKIVRPRRPEAGASAGVTERPVTPRPAAARPAPLVLVSEQRVDAAPTPAAAEPIRPRRVSAESLGAVVVEDEDEDFTPPTLEEARDFSDFASRLGAQGLSELLEAAAAYTATVEGRPHFSRPQIMKKVSVEDGFTREAGLRSFGMLLRQGKIQKVRRGQFAITQQSRFMADARRAAQ